jgi:hypothetical protein
VLGLDSNLDLNSNSFVLFELVCFSKKEKERKIREKKKERNPANPKPQPGPGLENPTQIPRGPSFPSPLSQACGPPHPAATA